MYPIGAVLLQMPKREASTSSENFLASWPIANLELLSKFHMVTPQQLVPISTSKRDSHAVSLGKQKSTKSREPPKEMNLSSDDEDELLSKKSSGASDEQAAHDWNKLAEKMSRVRSINAEHNTHTGVSCICLHYSCSHHDIPLPDVARYQESLRRRLMNLLMRYKLGS